MVKFEIRENVARIDLVQNPMVPDVTRVAPEAADLLWLEPSRSAKVTCLARTIRVVQQSGILHFFLAKTHMIYPTT